MINFADTCPERATFQQGGKAVHKMKNFAAKAEFFFFSFSFTYFYGKAFLGFSVGTKLYGAL